MSFHPSESASPIPTDHAVSSQIVPHAMLFAVGLICFVSVSGCKDSNDKTDVFAGRTAGEQRCFGLGHGVSMEFRWAPGGSFLMGCAADEPDRSPGESQRLTHIKNGFWIAEKETTLSVWRKIMGSDPEMKNAADHMPVAYVSWYDCREFLTRLRSPGNGWRYQLPTEAQWEYACRAGGASSPAQDLPGLGWIDANSGGKSHPVGKKTANAWSLHDMHGNVAEWCRDSVGDRGDERAIRGGSWDSDLSARATARNSDTPYLKINRVGFRLVLVREQAPPAKMPDSSLANH